MRPIVAGNIPHKSATIELLDSNPPMSPTPANDALLRFFSNASKAAGVGTDRSNR